MRLQMTAHWVVPLLCYILSSFGSVRSSSLNTGVCEEGSTGNTPGAGYVLVWHDEFNVDGPVCKQNWFHQTTIPTATGWFNNEEQLYTNRTDNAYAQHGHLNVVARKERLNDQGVTKEYTSARLNSKFSFTYGRVDVRARFDGGSGAWPAIWMLGKNVAEPGGFYFKEFGQQKWPACGEIDIMEHFGDGGSWKDTSLIHGSVHTPSSFGDTKNTQSRAVPDFDTAFHKYSILWEEKTILFMVDDVPYYAYAPSVLDNSTWPFDKPHYILLNFALGGVGGSIPSNFDQATMKIDYVRVYQRDPQLAAAKPPPDEISYNESSVAETASSGALHRGCATIIVILFLYAVGIASTLINLC